MDTLHSRILAKALSEGWTAGAWRDAVRARFLEKPFAGDGSDDPELVQDIVDMVLETQAIPDAWRIQIEGASEGWLHPVMVLEFLEVEVTHHLSEEKMSQYETLWWSLDATEWFHFRCLRIDRFGLQTPLVTEDTIHELGERRRLGGSRSPSDTDDSGA